MPGLIYKDGVKVRFNKPCLSVELDDLPLLDWSLQDPNWFVAKGVNGVVAYVDDSRGCPAKCAFCNASIINGYRPRHRSLSIIKNIIEELVLKYNVNVIAFTGNSFMSDIEYVKELCNWLILFNKPFKMDNYWCCLYEKLTGQQTSKLDDEGRM